MPQIKKIWAYFSVLAYNGVQLMKLLCNSSRFWQLCCDCIYSNAVVTTADTKAE